MSFCKKRIGEINLLSIIVITFILIVLIIIGSFYDLQISETISNQDSFFGKLFESVGQIFGYGMGSIAGAMITIPLFRSNSKLKKLFASLLALICFFGIPYFVKGNISGSSGYSWHFSKLLGYFIGVGISTIIYFVAYKVIDKEVKDRILIKNGLVILLTLLLSVIAINLVLKYLAYRPRYRAMAWDNALLNTKAIGTSYYQNWWQFSFFKKPDWIVNFNIPSDYIKSWPSGHTSCAACTLTLPYFTSVLKKSSKFKTNIWYYVAIFYSFFVAYERIVIGAHFLSDVAFGFLVTIIIMIIVIIVIEKNKNKGKIKHEEISNSLENN